ncbi:MULTISPECIES: hypothetical protein [Bradyrhizobium]|nr:MULTISPECIES: hypothetical protein [Bradyrhizobium]
MRTIKILGMLVSILTTIYAVTPASACPAGYFSCGGACCPGR